MAKQNEVAKDLWSQIFKKASNLPNATMHDPDYQSQQAMEENFTKVMLEAGWSSQEITERIEATRDNTVIQNLNSPGVGPGLEANLRRLSDRISQELHAIGFSTHEKIEVAIDPTPGVTASLVNVIMTDQAILTVSSFLFRWCGLIARAYVRTLTKNISHWTRPPISKKEDLLCLLSQPDLAFYWSRIFMSFAATGTHAYVPLRPSTRDEVILMEQVAWSMEYFTVAHEFGHHVLDHRSIDADPIEQEYEADRFAFRVCDRLIMEPFKKMENPYLRTGAGFTLMLKSLELLRITDGVNMEEASNTHPQTAERIGRIINRHVMQPDQLVMDQDFNNVVIRIMETVREFLEQYLLLGGRDMIRNIRNDL